MAKPTLEAKRLQMPTKIVQKNEINRFSDDLINLSLMPLLISELAGSKDVTNKLLLYFVAILVNVHLV